jgi:ribosomal protein S25
MTGLITFKKAAAVEDFTNVPDISEENIKQLQKELHSKAMIVRANIASRKFIEVSIGRFI